MALMIDRMWCEAITFAHDIIMNNPLYTKYFVLPYSIDVSLTLSHEWIVIYCPIILLDGIVCHKYYNYYATGVE